MNWDQGSNVKVVSSVVGSRRNVSKKTKGWLVKFIVKYNVICKHESYHLRLKQEQTDMESAIMKEYSTLDEGRRSIRNLDNSKMIQILDRY